MPNWDWRFCQIDSCCSSEVKYRNCVCIHPRTNYLLSLAAFEKGVSRRYQLASQKLSQKCYGDDCVPRRTEYLERPAALSSWQYKDNRLKTSRRFNPRNLYGCWGLLIFVGRAVIHLDCRIHIATSFQPACTPIYNPTSTCLRYRNRQLNHVVPEPLSA